MSEAPKTDQIDKFVHDLGGMKLERSIYIILGVIFLFFLKAQSAFAQPLGLEKYNEESVKLNDDFDRMISRSGFGPIGTFFYAIPMETSRKVGQIGQWLHHPIDGTASIIYGGMMRYDRSQEIARRYNLNPWAELAREASGARSLSERLTSENGRAIDMASGEFIHIGPYDNFDRVLETTDWGINNSAALLGSYATGRSLAMRTPWARRYQCNQQMSRVRKHFADNVTPDTPLEIYGSYSKGKARLGEWPNISLDEAIALDKLPTDLSPDVLEFLDPYTRQLIEQKKRMGYLPSDMDIQIPPGVSDAEIYAWRQRVFNELNILIELTNFNK